MLPNEEWNPDAASARGSPRASLAAVQRRVYLLVALITAALAIVGFWPTYFGPLVAGTVAKSSTIHFHAAVYTSWLVLFVMQVVFAATGRIGLHRRLGHWMMAFGLVLIVAGLMVASDRFEARLATGDVFGAQRWLFGILRELGFFAPFLVAGYLYRKRPEIHKRLMIVATVILIAPAIGRMHFLGTPPPLLAYMLVWPVPVYLAMIHDFRTRRLIHPVYVVGIVAMLAMRLVLPFGSSQVWQTIASRITAVYETAPGRAHD